MDRVSQNALTGVGGHHFFAVELWTVKGLIRYHVLIVIRWGTREMQIAGVVSEPGEQWDEAHGTQSHLDLILVTSVKAG